MSQNLLSLLINLIAAAIGGAIVWGWKWLQGRRGRKRLRALRQTASEGEIAICVRVGGGSDPVPDARKYLREHQPAIKQLIVYRVSAEEAGNKLDEPGVSHRIAKDFSDLIREYGKGEVSRVHFFYSGMVAYPVIFGAMFNWCPLLVYHRLIDKGIYVPLYQFSRDWFYKEQVEFKSLKKWELLSVTEADDAPPPAQLRESSPAPPSTAALTPAPSAPVGAGANDTLKGKGQ